MTIVKNCENCWIKREQPNAGCPIMEVEFHGHEKCFAWVKDAKDMEKREAGCEAYQNTYNASRIKKIYTCASCGKDYLEYYHKRQICSKCGAKQNFISKKGGK